MSNIERVFMPSAGEVLYSIYNTVSQLREKENAHYIFCGDQSNYEVVSSLTNISATEIKNTVRVQKQIEESSKISIENSACQSESNSRNINKDVEEERPAAPFDPMLSTKFEAWSCTICGRLLKDKNSYEHSQHYKNCSAVSEMDAKCAKIKIEVIDDEDLAHVCEIVDEPPTSQSPFDYEILPSDNEIVQESTSIEAIIKNFPIDFDIFDQPAISEGSKENVYIRRNHPALQIDHQDMDEQMPIPEPIEIKPKERKKRERKPRPFHELITIRIQPKRKAKEKKTPQKTEVKAEKPKIRKTKQPEPKKVKAILLCFFCGKKFKHHLLENHMRTHTKERPYFCYYCQVDSAEKSNILYHMSTVHPGKPLRYGIIHNY